MIFAKLFLINTPKSFSDYLTTPIADSLFLNPVSSHDILSCIRQMDASKASGPYSIPSRILRLIEDIIAEPLSDIVNLSFVVGVFPERLKTAEVVPVYKKALGLPLTIIVLYLCSLTLTKSLKN